LNGPWKCSRHLNFNERGDRKIYESKHIKRRCYGVWEVRIDVPSQQSSRERYAIEKLPDITEDSNVIITISGGPEKFELHSTITKLQTSVTDASTEKQENKNNESLM
jgi:uncharacterized FlaG/YvyC family protein